MGSMSAMDNVGRISQVLSVLSNRQPAIVDIQILRVGQLVILCVPGEFTTMAGRRIKAAIYDQVGGLCCCLCMHVHGAAWTWPSRLV